MWNRTNQSDQESMGSSSQHQSHTAHNSMQQDKSCNSGKLKYVNLNIFMFAQGFCLEMVKLWGLEVKCKL